METTELATIDGFERPLTEEFECFDLPVRGALPPELCGTYIRNGANPRPGSPPAHLFLGDGMLHGLRLERGRARWYRNRWVRTNSYVHGTPYVRKNGTLDLTAGPANTSVVAHAGAIYALVESSLPYEVSRELETIGPKDFGGRLKTPFAAHPKRCPRTGELHGFGMKLVPGALTYHRIDAAGALMESRRIKVKGTTMMHDFALTRNYAIFMDLPIVFDMRRALTGGCRFAGATATARVYSSHRAKTRGRACCASRSNRVSCSTCSTRSRMARVSLSMPCATASCGATVPKAFHRGRCTASRSICARVRRANRPSTIARSSSRATTSGARRARTATGMRSKRRTRFENTT